MNKKDNHNNYELSLHERDPYSVYQQKPNGEYEYVGKLPDSNNIPTANNTTDSDKSTKPTPREFQIPVTWEVWDKVVVVAETIEDAIKYVKDNLDNIQTGTDFEYVYDSYRIMDGDDGDANIPDTVRYLQQEWNLSGYITGGEVDMDDPNIQFDNLPYLVYPSLID